MQSNQVSVWVPILVGIIGLVGVIAGQFVNAWREDRRWRREQAREDLRWARDNKRESVKLDRETKVLAFSQLLQSLSRAYSLLDRLRKLGNEKARADATEYLNTIHEIRLKAAEVQLICSADTVKFFKQETSDIWLLPAMMYGISVDDPKTGEQAGTITPKAAIEKITQFRSEFLRLARDELVIHVDHTVDSRL